MSKIGYSDISLSVVNQLPKDLVGLKNLFLDISIDEYTKIYSYMAVLSYLQGGPFHSDLIKSVNIDKYLTSLSTNLIYFDYDAGRPLIDFVFTKVKNHPFWAFFLKKICLHYVIEHKIKVNSELFLQAIVHFAFPLGYRNIFHEGKSIGTNVSDKAMSLDSNILKECVVWG